MAEMEDANRDLEQRALRNVRALVDKLESEEPLHPWKPIVLVGLAVIVAGVAMWVVSSRKAAVNEAHRQQLACEQDAWAKKAGDFDRTYRQAHPAMPYKEVMENLQREGPAMRAAAKAECDGRGK